jgi:hypothetical protein
MFYSSIPSPPSLSLSSPYSTNVGAEFASKVDNINNGKVPDICNAYIVLKNAH